MIGLIGTLLVIYAIVGCFVTAFGYIDWRSVTRDNERKGAAQRTLFGFVWPVLLIAYAVTAVPALIRDATRRTR